VTYAQTQFSGGSLTSKYRKYTFSFNARDSAPNVNNTFVVELDGKAARGATIYFGFFSLFPPTYKNKPNGMRIDLAEALADLKPSILRFPGGCDLEGDIIQNRWKWNETIGPSVETVSFS
jgi:alpha-L-arabinofuranosidase